MFLFHCPRTGPNHVILVPPPPSAPLKFLRTSGRLPAISFALVMAKLTGNDHFFKLVHYLYDLITMGTSAYQPWVLTTGQVPQILYDATNVNQTLKSCACNIKGRNCH